MTHIYAKREKSSWERPRRSKPLIFHEFSSCLFVLIKVMFHYRMHRFQMFYFFCLKNLNYLLIKSKLGVNSLLAILSAPIWQGQYLSSSFILIEVLGSVSPQSTISQPTWDTMVSYHSSIANKTWYCSPGWSKIMIKNQVILGTRITLKQRI